jgi:hypothetical protein
VSVAVERITTIRIPATTDPMLFKVFISLVFKSFNFCQKEDWNAISIPTGGINKRIEFFDV